MHGSSRVAAVEGQAALDQALASADTGSLAEDLFAVAAALDGNATLRRTLADPSREGAVKADVARRLLGGKVGDPAVQVVSTLAGQRWAADRDLSDTVETLAVQTVLAQAERSGHIDDVEDQLFRFERVVNANPALRDALTSNETDGAAKAGLVSRLLEGKAAPETVRLAVQAVQAPRGRRLDRTLESYLKLAAHRRDQLTAVVTSAVPLSEQQSARLRTALENIYGKSVVLQTVVDAAVMGGIHVQVGDEVVDGTILRRLDEARRHLSGGS